MISRQREWGEGEEEAGTDEIHTTSVKGIQRRNCGEKSEGETEEEVERQF